MSKQWIYKIYIYMERQNNYKSTNKTNNSQPQIVVISWTE
jgi:hypothetical protein